jgi:lysophospholipase L1-like esterase
MVWRSAWSLCLAAVVGCTTTQRVPDPAPSASSALSAVPAKLPAPTAAPTRYLALGDSFTIGTGAGPQLSFPARLVSRCPGGVELRNVAVNGYTTQDILDREMPEVARFAPAFVTLAAGANDIVRGSTPDEYRARLRTILSALQAAGVARIVTIPQPDWSRSPAARDFGAPEAIHARIVEANAILREETAAVGGAYVDLFPLMEGQARQGLVARDGLHPNAEAYDAWAAELASRGAAPCAVAR